MILYLHVQCLFNKHNKEAFIWYNTIQPKIFAGQKFSLHMHATLHVQWNKFLPCYKGCHRLYVIITMGQNIRGMILSPMRAEEKGKNLLQVRMYGTWVFHIAIHVHVYVIVIFLPSHTLSLPIAKLVVSLVLQSPMSVNPSTSLSVVGSSSSCLTDSTRRTKRGANVLSWSMTT